MSNPTDSSNPLATQPNPEFDFPEILYNFDDVLQEMLSNTLPLQDMNINGKRPIIDELSTLDMGGISADIPEDMHDVNPSMSCEGTNNEIQNAPAPNDQPFHNYDTNAPTIGYTGDETSYETPYGNAQTEIIPNISHIHHPTGIVPTGDQLARLQCPANTIEETPYHKFVGSSYTNPDAAQLMAQHIAMPGASQYSQNSTSARQLQAQRVPDLPSIQPETSSEARHGEFEAFEFSDQNELSRYTRFEVPSTQPAHNNVPSNPVQTRAKSPLPNLVFEDLTHAEAAMLHRYISKDWQAPAQDDTIPRTKHARAQNVVKLLDAMQDTTQCKDQQSPPAFRNRWTSNAIHKPDPAHMEKVCWKLVDIAERLHTYGPSSLSIYDNETLQIAHKSRDLTFEQRIDNICALLRLSKSRCFSLLKNENLETTVSAPAQRIAGLKTNFTQNGRRQKYLVAGRSLVKMDEFQHAIKDTEYFDAAPGDRKENMTEKMTQAEMVHTSLSRTGSYMHHPVSGEMHEPNDLSRNNRHQAIEHLPAPCEPVVARRKRNAEEAHLNDDVYRNQRLRIDMR
jgi:hypothetical protein